MFGIKLCILIKITLFAIKYLFFYFYWHLKVGGEWQLKLIAPSTPTLNMLTTWILIRFITNIAQKHQKTFQKMKAKSIPWMAHLPSCAANKKKNFARFVNMSQSDIFQVNISDTTLVLGWQLKITIQLFSINTRLEWHLN